jgi:hypothetical protein
MVALSIRTRIPFSVLLDEDDQTIATYLDILAEMDEAAREG